MSSSESNVDQFYVSKPFIDAFSGAVSGGIARMFVSPLDVIKIRFQVQLEPTHYHAFKHHNVEFSSSKYYGVVQAFKDIIREEGIFGLWKGIVPAQLLTMPYTAVQFVSYHKFCSIAAKLSKLDTNEPLSPYLSFIGGSFAGCCATVASYPFDLLRTILASQGEPRVYPNMYSACIGILKKNGMKGLFSGLSPTLIEIIPYSGLQFGLYSLFKNMTIRYNERGKFVVVSSNENVPPRRVVVSNGDNVSVHSIGMLQQFLCGLAGGMIAKTVCHPLDVVKKRFQVMGLQRHPKFGAIVEDKSFTHTWDALQKIVRHEGWVGLYKGIIPSVLKAAPSAAITFTVYEYLRMKLEPYAR